MSAHPFHPLLAISASAGSGKTYRLALRYIELLARGVKPERIVALTFTRKAAGEMSARVIERLARAAAGPAGLQQLAQDLGPDVPVDRAVVLRLLRDLVRALPALRIGTIDGFLAQVIRVFASELGLPGGYEILDEAQLSEARDRTLAGVLGRATDPAEVRLLVEAFKQAVPGEERTVTSRLESLVDSGHRLYLEAPDESRWGRPEVIWPQGAPIPSPLPSVDALADDLAAWAGRELGAPEKAKLREAWLKMADDLRAWQPERAWNPMPALGKRWLEVAFGGEARLVYNRKEHAIADPAPLIAAGRAMVGLAIDRRLKSTAAQYRLLRRYEEAYRRTVRAAGRLSFADFLLVLGMGLDAGRPPVLTRRQDAAAADRRIYLDYRLDGQFDHWLMDEFQDTSLEQWRVLGGLIDEVVQDAEEKRTFFYVGDVKQSIYGWRGGHPKLFGDLQQRYEPRMQSETLSRSWRSAPPVIEAVNRVFESLADGTGLPVDLVARWQKDWKHHEAAPPNAGLPGCVALYEIGREGGRGATGPDRTRRFALAARLAAELQERGVPRIALLVRSNKAGKDLTDHLRAAGLAAGWEGDSALLDNPVVSALVSLFQLALHPGDAFAGRHVAMSPLAAAAAAQGLAPEAVPAAVRQRAHAHGLHDTVRTWAQAAVGAGAAMSAFEQQRLEALAQVALAFDRRGDRDLSAFIRAVREQTVGGDLARPIRVLTIHKAKGLEFDAVILCDLQASAFPSRTGAGLSLHRDAAGAPAWVLDLPPADFAERDPVLDAHVRAAALDEAVEELCGLYVGMTRAKQGLYLVVTQASEKSTAVHPSDVLVTTLASGAPVDEAPIEGAAVRRLYLSGDEAWRPRTKPSPAAPPVPAVRPSSHPVARLERVAPSEEEAAAQTGEPAEWIFRTGGRAAASRGEAVHALFQRVGWIDEEDAGAVAAAWAASAEAPSEGREEILGEFHRIVAMPAVRAALSRPSPRAELWREQAFELAWEERWISGRFDRVVIERAADGAAVRAAVLDFKSDRVADEAALAAKVEIYRRQLVWYRRAAARLTGLPPERVTAHLLFTRLGRVVDIAD